MADKDHPVFKAPDNPEIPIWRYMDFAKFVDMLENDGLFMCRADKLGDPFEGTLSKITLDLTRNSIIEAGIPAEKADRIIGLQ